MTTSEFCREHGHKWEATQLFTVPNFFTEVHMQLRCANCGKTIAGHIDLNMDADETIAEVLGEFQDITGL